MTDDWRGPWRRAWQLMHEPPEWLGRKGAILLLAGVVSVVVGIDVAMLGDPVPVSAGETQLPHLLIPIPIRAGLWIGTGLLAVFGALYDRPRWERRGFVAACVMPVERAASFAWGFLVWALTADGPHVGWQGIVILLAVAALILALAWRLRRGAWSLLAVILAALALAVAVIYTLRYWTAPAADVGYALGWLQAVRWGGFALIVATAAGWDEHRATDNDRRQTEEAIVKTVERINRANGATGDA